MFIKRQLLYVGLAFSLLLTVVFSGRLYAQSIAKGYLSQDKDLRPSMVAALSSDSTQQNPLVERADIENPTKIIGVTTTVEENVATIASGEQSIYVQSGGKVPVFVSDINGQVKKGNLLTMSPLKGILMLGDSTTANIGIALEDFSAAQTDSQEIKTSNGTKSVLIGKLSVSLDKPAIAPASVGRTSIFRRLGKSATGKDLSELQVLAALIIFIVVMVAEGSIIYAAVSSSITSMGRNPLANKLIGRELVRVLITVIAVLMVGAVAMYIIIAI